MQPPTGEGICVKSPLDAMTIIHAARRGILPLVRRRLNADERRAIQSGNVYVWEQGGPNAAETGLGVERWTDSIAWGPGQVRDDFTFYNEKRAQPEPDNTSSCSIQSERKKPLVKQTYSVFLSTQTGMEKWNLTAYFSQDTVDQLRKIEDHPQLRGLNVPEGLYLGARSSPNREARV